MAACACGNRLSAYPSAIMRTLTNGTIQHGTQIFSPELRKTPTTYYAEDSGVGLALRFCCQGRARNIGVIGLGVGTIAAYGQPGDRIRFYEINPAVPPIAQNVFSYLRESGHRSASSKAMRAHLWRMSRRRTSMSWRSTHSRATPFRCIFSPRRPSISISATWRPAAFLPFTFQISMSILSRRLRCLPRPQGWTSAAFRALRITIAASSAQPGSYSQTTPASSLSRRLRPRSGSLALTPRLAFGLTITPACCLIFAGSQAPRSCCYLMPTVIESGPTRCSTRTSRKPASFIQPTQSAPV
jgi:hypothetical protein